MIKVYSSALDTTIEMDRIIGHIKGQEDGPTLIFVGGIHGNEPAGVFGLKRVLDGIRSIPLKGNVIAIAGNLSALENGIRFNQTDLNRLWTTDRMKSISMGTNEATNADEEEQLALNKIFQTILTKEKGPFYFFDIHTTSSETLPFLTVNDSLLNRYYTFQYPLPIILGIEEYLDGPILSYVNELGYVAFGFEAGQHDDMASIENCIAFVYLSLTFTGCLQKNQIEFQRYYDMLAKTTGGKEIIFEISSRYVINKDEDFKMEPGFFNFQKIRKHQKLALVNGCPITATSNARIFMPLYQAQGHDGFFTVKKIWKPLLKLSEIIRKYRLDRFLVWMPGINWLDHKKSGILVNKKIAKLLAKDIFHLFGYRSIAVDKHHYKMYNRETFAQYQMYLSEGWNAYS